MRLFFALMLPEQIQQELGRLRRRLDWLPVYGSWSAAENIHITLKFLGETPDRQVMPLVDAVKAKVTSSGPVTLQADHLVFFPPRGPSRVLGVGFTGDTPRLTQIEADLESVAAEQGFLRENRPYVPHATLARFRDGLHAKHRPRIEQDCTGIARLPTFVATEFQLMQSVLGAGGPQYAKVAGFGM